MTKVGNANLSLTFDFSNRISLHCIFDEVTQHEYLSHASMLFEFATDDGPSRQSDTGIAIDHVSLAPDATHLHVDAHSLHEPLTFTISIAIDAGATAAIVRLAATNGSPRSVFLRVVL